jgi:hypothetical protein
MQRTKKLFTIYHLNKQFLDNIHNTIRSLARILDYYMVRYSRVPHGNDVSMLVFARGHSACMMYDGHDYKKKLLINNECWCDYIFMAPDQNIVCFLHPIPQGPSHCITIFIFLKRHEQTMRTNYATVTIKNNSSPIMTAIVKYRVCEIDVFFAITCSSNTEELTKMKGQWLNNSLLH